MIRWPVRLLFLSFAVWTATLPPEAECYISPWQWVILYVFYYQTKP